MAPAFRFSPRVFDLGRAQDAPLERLLWALRGRPGTCALDSAGGAPNRFSVVGFDPVRVAEARSLADLRLLLASLVPDGELRADGEKVPGPFQGGFLGALSYELGVAGEAQDLPAPARACPLVLGGLYVDFLVLDHEADRAWAVLGDDPGDGRPDVTHRLGLLHDELGELVDPPEPVSGPLVRHVPGDLHEERIEEVRARIAAGDFYQANLAHRLGASTAAHPVALYAALRRANPGPYAAYVHGAGHAVLSSSPELLLEYDAASRHARTRPIKGTIERGADPGLDAHRAAELLASEKDRAELAMIVDLERNDLGRVCELGSVRVGEFPQLETYQHLHHLVADVHGVVREGLDAIDVLEALFPGGSITGAPKLACMQAIAELEGEGRGFFTGSAGFLGLDGSACFNILIRTLEWSGERDGDGCNAQVSFHVGGGITWSSDAASEVAETLLKGRAMAAVLGAELDGGIGAGLSARVQPQRSGAASS